MTLTQTHVQSGMGRLQPTRARTGDFPSVAKTFRELSQNVQSKGLLKRTPVFYILLGVGLALLLAGAIVGSIFIGDSWFQLLMAAAFAIIFTQIAFIAHEAGHRVIFASAAANDKLARVLAGLVGMSYSWWDSKHSRHHANPNKVGSDPDIDFDTISFVEEDAAKQRGFIRFITKRQGWLFFPLLTLEGLNLHLHSLQFLFARGPVLKRKTELTIIAARFIVLLVPLFIFLPVGKAFAFLGVLYAVFGVYMGASFAPNHKGMAIVAHDARFDFFTKQVRTSRNIRGGWWATWLMGGLNYQIEHHLFPNMPRMHLAKTRKLVKAKCEELDVPYTETSLMRSYAIVIDYLNRVGLAARDPFDCPMAAEYRRG